MKKILVVILVLVGFNSCTKKNNFLPGDEQQVSTSPIEKNSFSLDEIQKLLKGSSFKFDSIYDRMNAESIEECRLDDVFIFEDTGVARHIVNTPCEDEKDRQTTWRVYEKEQKYFLTDEDATEEIIRVEADSFVIQYPTEGGLTTMKFKKH